MASVVRKIVVPCGQSGAVSADLSLFMPFRHVPSPTTKEATGWARAKSSTTTKASIYTDTTIPAVGDYPSRCCGGLLQSRRFWQRPGTRRFYRYLPASITARESQDLVFSLLLIPATAATTAVASR